ncbi:cell division protein FtsK [Kutzneria sp. CA-103260]|nr:cell division protein FtsK [Kutzneria sp. CA-103260]
MGRVLTFPITPAGGGRANAGELATPAPPPVASGPVLDGEIVDEDEFRRNRSRRLVTVVARRVRQHPTARVAGLAVRSLVRHGYVAAHGHVSWARRVFAAATHGVIRQQIRNAHVARDVEALALWQDRLRSEKDARHTRLRNLPTTITRALLAVLVVVTVLAGILVVAGIGFELTPGGLDWDSWWALLADIWGYAVASLTLAIHAALIAGPLAWLYAAWTEGRRAASVPAWMLPLNERVDTAGVPITPARVVIALRDLGYATLRTSIKAMDDGAAGMLGPVRIAGCGVEVDVTLPSGVSTDEIQKRRRKLAENLDRHEHELFITIPEAARTVRLWIADSGALDEPIGPSPLVIDPTLAADVHSGRAPWGQDLRGDAAAISLWQRHLLITGLSNQGKTASLRALVLWLALDTSTEFRIADLKGVGDWNMFRGLASVLIQGPADEHVIAATEMLEAAVEEMERRLAAVDPDKYPDGVTRALSRAGKGFHPIFVVVDEAQQAFMCPAVGEDKRPYGGTKATSRYFMAARKIHNQGRAVNVVLWQGTQDPTDQNLPKMVREGAHIRASLVVGTEQQARMALGDKAINGGAAPHKLRQGLDKGTLVVAGDGVPLPPGQSSITVRTHFVSGKDATDLADRAKAIRGWRDTAYGTDTEARDFLGDVLAVMAGADRVKTVDILQRLKENWPAAYDGWSSQDFADTLKSIDVVIRQGRVGGEGGQRYVAGDDVRHALEHPAITDRTS